MNGPDDAGRLGRVCLYLLLVVATSLGAALLSWVLMERSFLDLKERLAPRLDASA